jgi:NTE family protein
VLPTAGTSSRDDSIFAYRDFSTIEAKIERTHEATLAYLDDRVSR